MIFGSVDNDTIKFSGKLDETVKADDLFALYLSASQSRINGQVVFDFGDCQMANSIGISTWINFLKTRSIRARYKNMPEWLVSQFNQLDELLVNAAGVDSVLAPYYCEETSDITLQIIDTRNLEDLRQKVDSDQFCEMMISGKSFAPDFEARDYFDFLFRMAETEGTV